MFVMSLRPHVLEPVPEDTARVARAAFPKGNPYLSLRDALGTIFQDDDFTALFPLVGQPGLSPWRLALVTIMQFRENLADRQAAEAVRARIDWKYLLGLVLTDSGFDFSALSEFRDRLPLQRHLFSPRSPAASYARDRRWGCAAASRR
jgi:transposase